MQEVDGPSAWAISLSVQPNSSPRTMTSAMPGMSIRCLRTDGSVKKWLLRRGSWSPTTTFLGRMRVHSC